MHRHFIISIRSFFMIIFSGILLSLSLAHAQNSSGWQLYQQKKYSLSYPLLLEYAENGDIKSAYTVAYMNHIGQGVEQNIERAIKWYVKAHRGGSADAAFRIAEIYIEGKHVIKSDSEAALYYEIALKRGLLKAGLPLGRLYSSSATGKVDMSKAVNKLELAALDPAGGESAGEAANFLAEIFRGGSPGLPINEDFAFEWLEVAAENGHAIAAAEVGLEYYNGNKVKKDYAKAFRLVRSAATRGHGIAQFNLGLFYYQGVGTRANPVKALAWFMIAKNTDPKTDNGTIEKFKAAMPPSKNRAAIEEYEKLNLRFSR